MKFLIGYIIINICPIRTVTQKCSKFLKFLCDSDIWTLFFLHVHSSIIQNIFIHWLQKKKKVNTKGVIKIFTYLFERDFNKWRFCSRFVILWPIQIFFFFIRLYILINVFEQQKKYNIVNTNPDWEKAQKMLIFVNLTFVWNFFFG